MLRLSAPTRKTFLVAGGAIVLGILAWIDVLDLGIAADAAYWLTAGGAFAHRKLFATLSTRIEPVPWNATFPSNWNASTSPWPPSKGRT